MSGDTLMIGAEGKHSDLRRHQKSKRQDTRPNARSDEHVHAILPNMTGAILLPVTRGHNRRTDDRKPNLAAMGMGGEDKPQIGGDRMVAGNNGKDVRTMF